MNFYQTWNEITFIYMNILILFFDIREQFPLLPLAETIVIAEELGIKHPTIPKTNEPDGLIFNFAFKNDLDL